MTVYDRNPTETPLRHSWGARFKSAREAMHLTEKEAGARLHLKPYLITIIETERFENGPPAIFMRGYIRSYGKLLNLSEKEIAQALTQLNLANPATSAPISAIQTQSIQYGSNVGWSTSLVVIVLIGLVGMWWHTHSRTSTKEMLNTVSTQTAQPIANTLSPVRQIPADPTPNELANPQVMANTTTTANPATAPTVNPVTNTTTPQPTVAAAPALTNPQAPVANNTQQPQTAETQTTNPAVSPATTAIQSTTANNQTKPDGTTEKPALATDQNNTTDEKQAIATDQDNTTDEKPAKVHRARTRTPDVASTEMAIPEQGLDSSDDNNNN